MSVSSVSTSLPQSAPVSSTAQAADGDFKAKGSGHEVKDADGDYRPTPPSTAASTTASATLSAVTLLTKGG